MRAIIETGGKQFKVAPNAKIRVPSVAGEPGDTITFDRVLYVQTGAASDGGIRLGAPVVDGAIVTAEIVRHGRGRKITVFKYKRRKRYQRKKGHRQDFTELRITGLSIGGRTVAAPDSPEAENADAFACPICGKQYETERGLKQHMSLSHKDG